MNFVELQKSQQQQQQQQQPQQQQTFVFFPTKYGEARRFPWYGDSNDSNDSNDKHSRKFSLLILFSSFIAALFLLPYFPGIWNNLSPASCYPDACFCEEVSWDSVIRQPINTWSSVSFWFIGTMVLWNSHGKLYGGVGVASFYINFFAIANFLTAIFVAFFHASLTTMAESFHIMGAFLMVNWYFTYNFVRLGLYNKGTFVAVYIFLNAVVGLTHFILVDTQGYLLMVMIVGYLLSNHFINKKIATGKLDSAYLWAAFGTVCLSVMLWFADWSSQLCHPAQTWFQPHAASHILSAFSALLVFIYYNTEVGNENLIRQAIIEQNVSSTNSSHSYQPVPVDVWPQPPNLNSNIYYTIPTTQI